MTQKSLGFAAAAAILALTACGSTSTAGGTATPSAPAKLSPSPAGTPAAIDPCQVVTQSEASLLAGATYTTSKEETTSGGAKLCSYGAQTVNVFEVLVATAASPSAAQAAWDQEKSEATAELQKVAASSGVTFTLNLSDTNLSGADRAAVGTFSASLSGHTLAGSAIYFLKGANFVAITDLVLDRTPPTTSAMEAQGQTSLGRLP